MELMYSYKDIRMATLDELKRIKWQAQETNDRRLLQAVIKKYNDIVKYDY